MAYLIHSSSADRRVAMTPLPRRPRLPRAVPNVHRLVRIGAGIRHQHASSAERGGEVIPEGDAPGAGVVERCTDQHSRLLLQRARTSEVQVLSCWNRI